MLHRDDHQSVLGDAGENPIHAIGSHPQTDMDSYYYFGPSTDLANTASLPRRSRFTTPLCKEPTWRPEPPIATRTTETYPHSRVGCSRTPGPADGALHRTAQLLAKLLSGSADRDVTALSEAVRAKLGITEPLAKPAMASPSQSLTSVADNLKRARVSRLVAEVTCPSPFHPCSGTVPIAELHDVQVTEAENRGLTALAPLASKPPLPWIQFQGVGRVANYCPSKHRGRADGVRSEKCAGTGRGTC